MGKRTDNSVISNLNIPSRVISKSQNAGFVQQRLGRNFSNVASVTTAQVQQSNADAAEAARQKIRSQQFSANEKKIFKLLEEIAEIELDLLKAGYDSDKKIEALVQSGMIASAQYQKAIMLLELKGKLGIAREAAAYQLGQAKLTHQSAQQLGYMQHKHTLDLSAIDRAYANKKALATTNQSVQIAQTNQRQLEMAAFRREVKALPGGSSQSAIGGWSSGSGGSVGGGGAIGGFMSGVKKFFGFS